MSGVKEDLSKMIDQLGKAFLDVLDVEIPQNPFSSGCRATPQPESCGATH